MSSAKAKAVSKAVSQVSSSRLDSFKRDYDRYGNEIIPQDVFGRRAINVGGEKYYFNRKKMEDKIGGMKGYKRPDTSKVLADIFESPLEATNNEKSEEKFVGIKKDYKKKSTGIPLIPAIIKQQKAIEDIEKDPTSYLSGKPNEPEFLTSSAKSKIKKAKEIAKNIENKFNEEQIQDLKGYYTKMPSKYTTKMTTKFKKKWKHPNKDGTKIENYEEEYVIPTNLEWKGWNEMGLDVKQPYPYRKITKQIAINEFNKLREINVDGEMGGKRTANETTDRYTQVLRSRVKLMKETVSTLEFWEDLKTRAFLVQKGYELNRKDIRTNYNKWEVKDGKLIQTVKTWDTNTNKPIMKPLYEEISFMRSVLDNVVGTNSQFKPYIARWLYNRFKPTLGVLDTFSGWGGRLVGAISLDLNYIGNDYNKKLVEAYKDMVSDLRPHFKSKVDVSYGDAATFPYHKYEGKYDFYFSSPPYIKEGKQVEKYEGMKDYSDLSFYTDLLIPAFSGALKYLPYNKWFCFNIPIDNYDRIKELLLGEADTKIGLVKGSRAGVASGKMATYKEFIYCYKKTKKLEATMKEKIANLPKAEIEPKKEQGLSPETALLDVKDLKGVDNTITHRYPTSTKSREKFVKTKELPVAKIKEKKDIFVSTSSPVSSPIPSPILPRKILGLSGLPKITEDKREYPLSVRRAEGYRTKGDLDKMGLSRKEWDAQLKEELDKLSNPKDPLAPPPPITLGLVGEGFATGIFNSKHPDNHKLVTDGYDHITRHSHLSDYDGEIGGGFRDLFRGVRTDYPPKVMKFLGQYGGQPITNITVFRQPLARALTSAMNFLSMGKWKSQAKKHSYDTFYHLGMILELEDGTNVICEKNDVLNIGIGELPQNINRLGGGTIQIKLQRPIPLMRFLDEGEKVLGDKFFTYNPFTNNCQVFVLVCLKSNRIWNAQLKEFIYQDIKDVVKAQPTFFQKLAPAVTQMASKFNSVTQGSVERDALIDPSLHKTPYKLEQAKNIHIMPNGETHTEKEHNEYSVNVSDEQTDDVGGGAFTYDTPPHHLEPPHNLPSVIYDLD
tara:strand:+ start:347 stop:3523 length:3177 start_codon:yes stop_codon:yes gene_type:complete